MVFFSGSWRLLTLKGHSIERESQHLQMLLSVSMLVSRVIKKK